MAGRRFARGILFKERAQLAHWIPGWMLRIKDLAWEPETNRGKTDGRANVAMNGGDPWHEPLVIASQLHCAALVVDTETAAQPLGQSRELAQALGARYVALENIAEKRRIGYRAATGAGNFTIGWFLVLRHCPMG